MPKAGMNVYLSERLPYERTNPETGELEEVHLIQVEGKLYASPLLMSELRKLGPDGQITSEGEENET